MRRRRLRLPRRWDGQPQARFVGLRVAVRPGRPEERSDLVFEYVLNDGRAVPGELFGAA